jgi:hypothetical protein
MSPVRKPPAARLSEEGKKALRDLQFLLNDAPNVLTQARPGVIPRWESLVQEMIYCGNCWPRFCEPHRKALEEVQKAGETATESSEGYAKDQADSAA